ncbi:MAG: 3-dehydroquinate synthase [Gammaproteobacteria bacterium]|nr:3-dehydroquinate synthase [Gammaproteobacteria bacterium]
MSINQLNFNYSSVKNTVFIIDSDPNLAWLSTFDTVDFERLIVCYDQALDNQQIEGLFKGLTKQGKEILSIPLVSSEETKSISSYCSFVQALENNKCSRFDLVLAIGGGTILDLVSFAVSTYMRGLPLMMIPTTLIGQVDASTAGKTCINSDGIKNLLGTFYYPKIVYNNVNFLTTQTYYHFRQGISEILKYGLLDSEHLVAKLSEFKRQDDLCWLREIVELTIKSRVKICKIDPAASNLGHTFGHAIEKLSKYKIPHGDAINIGTVMALYFSLEIGIIDTQTVSNILILMRKLNLNLHIDSTYSATEFVRLMKRDKKSSGKHIYLVLIEGIGKPYESNGSRFYQVSFDVVEKFVANFLRLPQFRMEN